jgi:hypothetical protein
MLDEFHCFLHQSANLELSVPLLVILVQLPEISRSHVQVLACKIITQNHELLDLFILFIEHLAFNQLCFLDLGEVPLLLEVELPHPLLQLIVLTPIR